MESETTNTPESFADDLKNIAEQVKTNRGAESTSEQTGEGPEKQRVLDTIREVLEKEYIGSGTAAEKIPPRTDIAGKNDYLDGIPEQHRETIADYVREAVTDGIAKAVARVQEKRIIRT